MKIILIWQAEPPRDGRLNAAAFARSEEAARTAFPAPANVRPGDAAGYRISTGTSPCAAETAALLFYTDEPPERTALLDDVPLQPFRDTEAALPLWLWRALGAAQWRLGSPRQSETAKETLARAEAFADRVEADGRDCAVISRGLTMAALKTVLRRRGYLLEGGELLPRPLDRVRASKRSEHCGGCHHNCLLSQAKCRIGQEKAARQSSG